MKRKTVSGMMLALMLISLSTLAFNIQPVKASGTIYIRADGSIEPSTAPIKQNGDVYTLTDNIDSDSNGIMIERDNMVLDGAGYKLQGTGTGFGNGIVLSHTSNVTIKSTEIRAFFSGISLGYSSDNFIIENSVASNFIGISPMYSPNNSIFHNNFADNTVQVHVSDFEKKIWDNGYPSGGNYWSDYLGVDADGDGIGDTPYVIDVKNQDRYPLMHLWSSLPVHNINTGLGYATIQEAINADETLDGHKIFVEAGTYYEHVVANKTISLVGENRATTIIDGGDVGTVVKVINDNIVITGFTLRNGIGYPDDQGVLLNHVEWCNVSGNIIVHNVMYGIRVASSSNNVISRNIITDNPIGISLDCSSNNTIIENNASKNLFDGIYLINSSNNTILHNNLEGQQVNIELFDSSCNTIFENNVTKGRNGIFVFRDSSNNKIYHNNITDNEFQVYIQTICANFWDDGCPSGGNYWSDYVGVDVKSGAGQDLPGSDGMGDMPYIIDTNNRDRYPLMNPYGAPPPPTYTLTITTTAGGTTNPAPGTYSYTANSTVQVTAIPDANYLFDHWELDTVNVGSVNPQALLMDRNHTLKAAFSPKPAVPVGGYSLPIKGHITASPLTLYLVTIAILATVFTATRRKIPKKK